MGSFSKLLLPSVRLSYMALPAPLLEQYAPRARAYNQTASKIEQLALADYIRSGQLERHLRRMRKLYGQKSQLLLDCLHKTFGEKYPAVLRETSLSVLVQMPQASQAAERASPQGVRVSAAGEDFLRLGFAGIPFSKIPDGVEALYQALFSRNQPLKKS